MLEWSYQGTVWHLAVLSGQLTFDLTLSRALCSERQVSQVLVPSS